MLLLLLSRFSSVRLCNPIDGSPPGSPVPGILQEITLEWVAISFSNAWKWKMKVRLLTRCRTLHDPMDCSLTGSAIHGIFQARVLEWVAIAFSDWEHRYFKKMYWAEILLKLFLPRYSINNCKRAVMLWNVIQSLKYWVELRISN